MSPVCSKCTYLGDLESVIRQLMLEPEILEYSDKAETLRLAGVVFNVFIF